MTCEWLRLPGGGTAIVKYAGRRAQTCACGKPSTRLCDWKLRPEEQRRRLKSVTCDRPLCDSCTHSPAPDKDLCPSHATLWRARSATNHHNKE